MEISVLLTSHWVTIEKPFSILKKNVKIAKEVGDQRGEGEAYGNLGIAFDSLGDYRKAIEYHERYLKIAKEIGDWAGELRSYRNIGTV